MAPTPTDTDAFDPVRILRDRFAAAMRDALGDDLPDDADPLIQAARNPDFGDFQSNAAMPLAKAVGKPPRDVAKAIAERLDLAGVAEPLTDKSIAGPGFINVTLQPAALSALLERFDGADLGVRAPANPMTVVVDLCGVNLSKQLHVGHLRATVIGDAVARLFERLGHRVIRQNHLGDWGLPIAMVVRAIQAGQRDGTLDPANLVLDDLDRLYRDAQLECKADRRGLQAVERFDLGPKAEAELSEQVAGAEAALGEARQTLVKMQAGDAETVRVWEVVRAITMRECMAVCARLNAKITDADSAGESSYREDLAKIVEDLESRRVATESQGALIVDVSDEGIEEPLLVRKSDGGFLYATTDLAAIKRRVQDLGADEVVYTVDARQSLHFRQVFAAARKASYATKPDGTVARLEHAAFGTVLGPDNKPFKTRSGENVKLSALLDEAVQRAEAAVNEKNPDLPESERRSVAEAVGMTAIKYADLATDRVKDYVFDFDRMLAFEGDTGPYLQYALVRIRSINRKAQQQGVDAAKALAAPYAISEPPEKALALAVLRFPSVLQASADHLEPHRLCAYLQDLARAFSAFFENCPVLRAPDEPTRDARLRLCDLTGRVLESGMTTLGLIPLERM